MTPLPKQQKQLEIWSLEIKGNVAILHGVFPNISSFDGTFSFYRWLSVSVFFCLWWFLPRLLLAFPWSITHGFLGDICVSIVGFSVVCIVWVPLWYLPLYRWLFPSLYRNAFKVITSYYDVCWYSPLSMALVWSFVVIQ